MQPTALDPIHGSTILPTPPTDRPEVVDWVRDHLGHLCCDEPAASPAFRGGQQAADEALENLDIDGYARNRSMVHPPSARGASKMSPYIRYGLLDLPTVWAAVDDAPGNDRFKYRSELLWQEYARHWYALYGRATSRPAAFEPPVAEKPWPHDPWYRTMRCIDATLEELETDGWCVNQTRMWLAGQHSLRGHGDPFEGEQQMFQHLLDGSRAANRLGWQWTSGTSRSRAYTFSRRQVQKRAPAFCRSCELEDNCPIRGYADAQPRAKVEPPAPLLVAEAFGPLTDPDNPGSPDAVWLTAESLGDADPALAAHPDAPVVFVFDEPLLAKLQLSGKRLVFLAETLADLAGRRNLTVHLGRPVDVLAGTTVAVTHAPVPGFRSIASRLPQVVHYPWPWLRPPTETLGAHFSKDRATMPFFKQWCKLTET